MTRICSKGMFNDFFGQWNAHVHCWCNTNNKIKKQQLCVVSSFPLQLHFLFELKFKNGAQDVWSATHRLTSRGRASSYQRKKRKNYTWWINLHLCMIFCYARFHSWTLGTRVSIWENGDVDNKPVSIIKVSWAQPETRHSRIGVIWCKR